MRNKPIKLRIIFALIVFGMFTLSLLILSVIFNRLLPTSYPLTGATERGIPATLRLLILGICFMIGLMIEGFVNRKIFRPISRLNESMKEVAKGNFDLNLTNNSNIHEVKEMMGNFQLMTKELSNIEMFRNDFVNSVSHEFKTPMAAIEGYATLLQSDDLTDEERQSYTTNIINNTKRLTNLSNNILKLSRLENQELYLEKSNFDLAEQIRTAILTLEREWGEKEIELDIDIDEIDYHGNHDLLFQVWLNLIHNAIKFTPRKGEIKISLKQEDQRISFQIVDNGIGITPETRKHIFEKFYQSDRSQNSEGNGLGLPLVRRIVNLHKGIINVESTVGIGSTFTVTLV